MSALPKELDLLTIEDAAAKEQLKQFRRRISQFGTSNGPTIDRYTASCRGWVKALRAASGAYYGRHVQDGALPQETFIRIAREIFEPRLQRFCGELLEILCDGRFLSLVADRCDDITRAINQLERAWTPSSLISQQPQVFPAMEAVETAIKRLDVFRPSLLTKRSPPVPPITAAVAVRRYRVSGKTLARAVADGRLPMIATARSNRPRQIRRRDLERFRQSIESWERHGREAGRDGDVELAAAYVEDVADHRAILRLIETGALHEAAEAIDRLDTLVRDQIPIHLYDAVVPGS